MAGRAMNSSPGIVHGGRCFAPEAVAAVGAASVENQQHINLLLISAATACGASTGHHRH
jgi:hypothetical protein